VLNYNHLYYFHVTASEGSVARAAARLGIGVPTVSEQIRQLERELGIPLFEMLVGSSA
jgi:LysR family transcriptional regulator, transcriptional activator of nhaA